MGCPFQLPPHPPRPVGCPAPSVAAAGEPGSAGGVQPRRACEGSSYSPLAGEGCPPQRFPRAVIYGYGSCIFLFPFNLKLSQNLLTNSSTVFPRYQDHGASFPAPQPTQTIENLLVALTNANPEKLRNHSRPCSESAGPASPPTPARSSGSAEPGSPIMNPESRSEGSAAVPELGGELCSSSPPTV